MERQWLGRGLPRGHGQPGWLQLHRLETLRAQHLGADTGGLVAPSMLWRFYSFGVTSAMNFRGMVLNFVGNAWLWTKPEKHLTTLVFAAPVRHNLSVEQHFEDRCDLSVDVQHCFLGCIHIMEKNNSWLTWGLRWYILTNILVSPAGNHFCRYENGDGSISKRTFGKWFFQQRPLAVFVAICTKAYQRFYPTAWPVIVLFATCLIQFSR